MGEYETSVRYEALVDGDDGDDAPTVDEHVEAVRLVLDNAFRNDSDAWKLLLLLLLLLSSLSSSFTFVTCCSRTRADCCSPVDSDVLGRRGLFAGCVSSCLGLLLGDTEAGANGFFQAPTFLNEASILAFRSALFVLVIEELKS